MASKDNSRIVLLEEEIRNLSEELVQCQADKEFVWSLWKRLQVANPDLTQAVSLVVEREKQKSEAKDRKVLEILQAKDYKIQELEQRVTGQQQEINNLAQRKWNVDEDRAEMKTELSALQHKLGDRSQELKELREQWRRKEEEQQRAVRDLEEAKAGLDAHCYDLQLDLNKLHGQEVQWRQEKYCIESKARAFENELKEARQQVEDMHHKYSCLTAELSARETELTLRGDHVTKLRTELHEMRALYQQSVQHASEQAQLIQQLEGLNLDTQQVMRSQEAAHTADTVSYQKLYNELSVCYEALKSNEAQLRQSHISLTTQLCQKEQRICELQACLQQAITSQPVRLTSATLAEEKLQEVWKEPQSLAVIQQAESEEPSAAIRPSQSHETETCLPRRQGTAVQRSRSLSPTSCSGPRLEIRWDGRTDRRICELEELLRLKTEENNELRRVHEKQHERLRFIKTNYRTMKEQLRVVEDGQCQPRGGCLRAEPWQLCQEDSDAVWNELAHFKRLNKKLLTDKTNLEEELDVLRVQAAMDRTTIQELRVCLRQEQEELAVKEGEDAQVRSSTPRKLPAGRVGASLEEVERLEVRVQALEEEVQRLRAANQELEEAREELQASILRLRSQAVARVEAIQAQSCADRERQEALVKDLESQLAMVRRERDQSRRRLLKLRQELGIVQAARVFTQLGKHHRGKAAASAKPRQPTAQPGGLPRHQPASHSSKDGWEDFSEDSDSGEAYTDSLDSHSPEKSSHPQPSLAQNVPPQGRRRPKDCAQYASPHPHTPRHTHPGKGAQQRRGTAQRVSSLALQRRIMALQQQITVLHTRKRTAQRTIWEQRETNKKITSQLNSLTQRLDISKQLSQKLTSDLSALEKQKAALEHQKAMLKWELEQSRQQKPLEHPPLTQEPPSPVLQKLEAEIKRLQAKLKHTCNEVTKHTTANKSLRSVLQTKEEQLRELHDKLSHMERDMSMKRHLMEDLKSRLKIFQSNDKTYKGLIEDLEKKVKTLSEETSNRKAFIDSLRRRLSVVTKEKCQYELSSQKLRDSLDKKDQKVEALQARVLEYEQSIVELERTASHHMHGLAEQSTQALESVQRKLALASTQLEQLHTFITALASEINQDTQDTKCQLRKNRRRRGLDRKHPSNKSMMRAQSIAASILHVSKTDLEDMLDTDEDNEEAKAERKKDQDWLDQVLNLLQQQIPSVALLMEAMRSKLRERKVLTEELAALRAQVSKKA
ncbi:centlein [Megalops cyprinoides]|uniref:centlein n=1 Tax=Megalops cyprinoides TaxID=118141 RepID=UPI001864710E|nr:centlein [Megalops cyprinoides]